jgi:hypothetical protein
MSIQNFGKKLIKDGELLCEPRLLIPHDFQQLWAPDFMESIVFIKASKDKYSSSLHFFWQTIFHQREVSNLSDAEEILNSTNLYRINYVDAKKKIKSCCPDWFEEHENLIPNAKWTHKTWDDKNDVFIIFEDDDYFYGWGWDIIE